ncbi:HAMP domain-containing sensor histidine kinase [Streptosporangium sp. NPDC002524]|uniref:sensor histidine kinase n=1 Tax=Streptosporangium sp. NPDC002524 TaxID=3154537 RepID=UPI003330F1A6
MRLTIRMRLTLLYSGMFLVAGVALLGVTYLLMRAGLREQLAVLAPSPRCVPPAYTGCDSGDKILYLVPREQVLMAQRRYEQTTLRSLLTQGYVALALVGAAALGLGWLVADRALRPIRRVTETARKVAHGRDLTERIAYTGPGDHIKELADTFDIMLSRLAHAFDGQRRFVANASHELRTPLAINRTLVDVAVARPGATEDVKRLGEALLTVNARHEQLINSLLILADSERPILNRHFLDLADVAEHVVDLAAPEAGERGVSMECSPQTAPTTGDSVLLERLVQNLVENAIRHNHAGGRLWVTTQSHAGRVRLVVANTGPVVPAYEIGNLFEPFRRLHADRLRSGHGNGLGLSIVRAITEAHGGVVTARPRDDGGLTVTVELPAELLSDPTGRREDPGPR